MKLDFLKSKRVSDILFILWAGIAVLLSYSLVYALRKPYTAASFEGLSIFGCDYKVVVTTAQLVGYLISKFVGVRLIPEMNRNHRFHYFVGFVLFAEFSLLLFGLLPTPYNIIAMFLNGLSLGCMWGIIFSFIEGRKVTDLLASLLGVSMVISSGMAKSVALFAINELAIDPFWMPAVIGGIALPILLLMGYLLKILPPPTAEDVELRSERVKLTSAERKALFWKYSSILTLLFLGSLFLLVLRDIKEDFLVNIVDTSQHSSWMFVQIDSIVTVVTLTMFALLTFIKNSYKVMIILLILVIISCAVMGFVSYFYESLHLSTVSWLLIQSLTLYTAYLTFQTIFFERFVAAFKIRGNIGFFGSILDFVGYFGTVSFLIVKEVMKIGSDWFVMYNNLAFLVSILCVVMFIITGFLMVKEHNKYKQTSKIRDIKIKPEMVY